MLAFALAILATAWLGAADDNPSYNPHGAVIFVRTGERTPLLQPGTPKLSPLGAQQMRRLGQQFRGRYIGGDNDNDGLGQEPINNLAPHILDPNQLLIQALDTPYTLASAQAFMQAFYPPYSIKNGGNGSVSDNIGMLANDTTIDYPFDGYQYAPIQVLGQLDPQSVYIAGDQNCLVSIQDSLMYQTTEEYMETRAISNDLYGTLNESLFDNHLEKDKIDYYNALQIYDYLSYAYNHDSNIHELFTNDTNYQGVYDRLRWYADESAWYFWGNTSSSSSDEDYHAMAGKMLAALVLDSFQKIWANDGNATNGNSHPLTLLFGEHEPIISLVSLMLMDFMDDNFRALPPYASTIVFELFSRGSDASFPSDPQDLFVNFFFQNGTNYNGSLLPYPMFGRKASGTDMPWLEFQDMMSRIMTRTLADWCSQCSSRALFCWGVDDSTIEITLNGIRNREKISPTVAGVIGAVVTLGVAGILFAVAMLVGGIRFHRVARSKKSELGGFKGSAKLASDQDLSLPKNGAAPAGIVSLGSDGAGTKKATHERVGSWELRQKEFGGKTGDLGDESRRESFEAIEAAMSRPVEATERV